MVYIKYTLHNQFCLEISWFLIILYTVLKFHSVIFSERNKSFIFVTNRNPAIAMITNPVIAMAGWMIYVPNIVKSPIKKKVKEIMERDLE